MSFQTRVNGKWILTGEHAVLRGAPALVFPLYSRHLDFSFDPNARSSKSSSKDVLQLELQGEHGEELQLLFWGVLEKACSLRKIYRQEIRGLVKMSSTIPVGAGLGASAALSVAVAKWFQYLKVLNESELLEFSRQLENLFHGESSGVDLAVALSGKPLKFVRPGSMATNNFQTFLMPTWSPRWYVSYSGKRGVTMECVNKVKQLIQNDPQLGQKIDHDMAKAVEMSEAALLSNPEKGLPLLADAIELARSCFDHWGLSAGNVEQHMAWLKIQGAIATKPTGSGNGGYVLSLWDRPPSREAQVKLIPCF